MTNNNSSLQKSFAPNSICFGCGPANTKGLQIQSFAKGDFVTCEWLPEKHHEAFPTMLNGGIIGSLLDCHCNWTAAWTIKNKLGLKDMPCTVTAEYSIKLLRPTLSAEKVYLEAKAVEMIGDDRVWVEGILKSKEKTTATCRGLFVAVKEGHPAYHRWG
jgi:acyl-coenzyme A thioesterase PaaI-like protein